MQERDTAPCACTMLLLLLLLLQSPLLLLLLQSPLLLLLLALRDHAHGTTHHGVEHWGL